MMNITPSNWEWLKLKDLLLMYTIIGAVPAAVIVAIINIRANPELAEIPEGYEPREWEYYKHPISRFIARYLMAPQEADEEMIMDAMDRDSENMIMQHMHRRCEKVMAFYNDHRSRHFVPWFMGEYKRRGRYEAEYHHKMHLMMGSDILEKAYDPSHPLLPVEGYKPEHFANPGQ